MNEIKPEDVMRALEHCANYKRQEVSCIGCPLYGKCDVNTLEGLALSLLREKDAERKELWEERCRIYESMREWEEECKKYRDALREKDAEIERLEKEVERRAHILESYALQYGTARDKEYFSDKVRVETINEFGRRLKTHECLPEYPWNEPFVLARDIDQIAKEMKGDQR